MIKLIPEPYKYTIRTGTFNINKGFTINYPDVWQNEIDYFAKFIKSQNLSVTKDSLNTIDICLTEGLAKEGYLINIDNNHIKISASTATGCFYALVTMQQLIISYKGAIPCLNIEDKPRFNYRGFMLDVGRYFYTVNEVKHFIDLMAIHKLNFFHIHLTEDQGWRIEIKKYPLLTEHGSKRSHTNFNMIPHGGYYTQDEIKEIVSYAHARHIKVIPEIDMPGHMQAALHAYPELGCFDRKLPVATHWGIKHDILCGGKDSTRQFVKDVIDEIIRLFPDKFIHIGGDEAIKTRWKICPHCQEAMKKKNLKNENELQADFINEINSYIRSKGYSAIMWNEDEISGRISQDIIWMVWNAGDKKHPLMLNEMKNGRLLINAESEPYYLDLPYKTNTLKEVYNKNVNFVEPDERLIGMESALWTEFIPNVKNAHFKAFPRLGAFAEKVWGDEKNMNYDNFLSKIDAYYALLKTYGVTEAASVKRANPSPVLGFFERLWFERRQLCWHGLHNAVDNAKVQRMAKKKGYIK